MRTLRLQRRLTLSAAAGLRPKPWVKIQLLLLQGRVQRELQVLKSLLPAYSLAQGSMTEMQQIT